MAAIWAAVHIGILFAVAIPLSRGWVRAIQAMTVARNRLASGELSAEIPARDRSDEVGSKCWLCSTLKRLRSRKRA